MSYLTDKRNALLMNAQIGGGILPSEYQQVEWIGSSGTQYIDTTISLEDTMKWELEFASNGTTWSATGIGATTGQFNNQSISVGVNGQQNYTVNCGSTHTTTTPKDSNKHTVVIDRANGVGKFDYEDITFTTQITTTPIRTMYLFSTHFTIGASAYMKANIYSSKIYENGTLIQDLIPCYHKTSGEIGMYDTISQTFFTNSGSGTFTKGNDVN